MSRVFLLIIVNLLTLISKLYVIIPLRFHQEILIVRITFYMIEIIHFYLFRLDFNLRYFVVFLKYEFSYLNLIINDKLFNRNIYWVHFSQLIF